jgi:hypothetical protein
MTREELAQRINLFEGGHKRREWLAFAFLIGGLFVGMLISTWFGKTYPTLQPVRVFIFPACIVLPSLGFVWFDRRRSRAFGLSCPECGTSLAGVRGRLAVTTCHCDRCGKKIVEDDASPSNSSQKRGEHPIDGAITTAAELAQRLQSFEKDSRRREWLLAGFMIAWLFLILLIVTRLFRHHPFLGLIVLVMLLIFISLPSFILTNLSKRQIKALRLSCPECDQSLRGEVGQMAVASCYCGYCGKKIVE